MLNPITFAVVGDSAASGVGDSDDYGNHFGWTYHLAKAFHEPLVYINASRTGARSAEVLNIQLPVYNRGISCISGLRSSIYQPHHATDLQRCMTRRIQ